MYTGDAPLHETPPRHHCHTARLHVSGESTTVTVRRRSYSRYSLASFDGSSGVLLLRRCNVIRKEMRKLITLCVSKMLDFHVQIHWPLSEEWFHYEIRTGFTMSASHDQHDVFLL